MQTVRRRFLIEWVVMFLLLPSALVWLDGKPGLAEVNSALYDRMLLRKARSPSADVLVVGIDQRSVDALGSWPFSRTVHARLLDQLAQHAPKAVLLDLFFDQPAADPADDRALGQAMTRLPVYLPLFYEAPAVGDSITPPRFRLPVNELARHAAGIGHVNATPDDDGLVRGIWRLEGPRGALRPYIGLAIAGLPAAPPGDARRLASTDWVRQGRFGIPFAGREGTYPTVSYVDVLNGRLTARTVQDKIVVVGAAGDANLGDTMPVAGIGPLTSVSSAEIQANAIDALLHGETIELVRDVYRVLWISVPIWLAFALFLRSARHAIAVGVLLAGVCVGANWALLIYGRISLPLASPLFGIVLAYMLWSWRRLAALLVFFRQRAEALNAVPADLFEATIDRDSVPIESVERRTQALDRAIDRINRLRSLLTEGLWQLPVPVLICRIDGLVSQSNAAARALLVPSSHASHADPPNAAADPLAGVNLPRMLASLERVELPGAGRRSEAGLWAEAASCEFTTRQGRIFQLRAAALHGTDHEAAEGWVIVLPDVTLERAAQRDREQWFGFLSHDLRSPQVTILSLLAMHAEAPPGTADVAQLANNIGRQAHRTILLAENFMEMVEAESGVYRFAPAFAGAAVLDAVDAAWTTARTAGVALEHHIGSDDCLIRADLGLLTRALVNLLNNAIRHSPAGSTIMLCVDAQTDDAGGMGEVVISVRDEGEGMSAEQLSNVVSAGSRERDAAPAGRRVNSARWGVGMTVVHAVVMRHDGWLDGISAPGAGTTFFIGLPLARDEASPEISERPSGDEPSPPPGGAGPG